MKDAFRLNFDEEILMIKKCRDSLNSFIAIITSMRIRLMNFSYETIVEF